VSEVVIPGAVAKDVFSRLSWFAAGALVLAIEGEALSELFGIRIVDILVVHTFYTCTAHYTIVLYNKDGFQ